MIASILTCTALFCFALCVRRWNILRKHDKPNEFVSSNLIAGGVGSTKDKNKHRPDVYRILLVEKDEVFAYFFYNILFYQQKYEHRSFD